MRHDELYVADLVDSTRAICEYLDGITGTCSGAAKSYEPETVVEADPDNDV